MSWILQGRGLFHGGRSLRLRRLYADPLALSLRILLGRTTGALSQGLAALPLWNNSLAPSWRTSVSLVCATPFNDAVAFAAFEEGNTPRVSAIIGRSLIKET